MKALIIKFAPICLLGLSLILFFASLGEPWYSVGPLKVKLFKICGNGNCIGYDDSLESDKNSSLRKATITFTFFAVFLYIAIFVLFILSLINLLTLSNKIIHLAILCAAMLCVFLSPVLFGSADMNGLSFSHGFYLSLFGCLFGLIALIFLVLTLFIPALQEE